MTSRKFSPSDSVILGFDPGRDKCGVAVMGLDRQLQYHEVLSSSNAIATIKVLYQKYAISLLVMGDQTTSKLWKQQIQENLSPTVNIILVDERYTSLEARDRYWIMYPPKGFTKLLPAGMRTPPRPIDDIVAILLIERYLNRLTQ
ncbi:pre-16S rRNA-processing nuclease YqgF [Rivularia sp. UHCC 0363]|uniref:pre-16S rRNA-processing nuclease YqgF n=1 Tax=Rivularia sp. UHCC 0363 TaxID=3110244 RepID=UPI002B20F0DE|nr:pre-16S rRNA-processing nuclease YqgF [Rivularia sp. UHCC 0363]MEA5594603.1 pre-16S rRNA-processing nuclease YqgF [Rivularia sp. UHCC 0363]